VFPQILKTCKVSSSGRDYKSRPTTKHNRHTEIVLAPHPPGSIKTSQVSKTCEV